MLIWPAGPATSNKPRQPASMPDAPRQNTISRSGRPRRNAPRAALCPVSRIWKAQHVPVQQDIGEDHRDKRRNHAPVHAGSAISSEL